jgi:hypothetical protein
MTAEEQSLERWKRAYRVLDVPASASALTIKSNYRKLIKRWHPDRPPSGSSTPSEATLMTKLINEAYGLIENAPLRYYSGEPAVAPASANPNSSRKRTTGWMDDSQAALIEKRVEYGVRIACGILSGAFFGLAFSVDFLRNDGAEVLAAIVLCAVGFAAGAVRYGDRFWRIIFGRWWMWE